MITFEDLGTCVKVLNSAPDVSQNNVVLIPKNKASIFSVIGENEPELSIVFSGSYLRFKLSDVTPTFMTIGDLINYLTTLLYN